VAFASRPVCVACRCLAVIRRRRLPPAVRWKTPFLDRVHFEGAVVVERTAELAYVLSTAFAAPEVCW